MLVPKLTRWISVDEFLPDEDALVLAFGVDEDGEFFSIAQFNKNEWIDIDDCCPLGSVTHWQLLAFDEEVDDLSDCSVGTTQ